MTNGEISKALQLNDEMVARGFMADASTSELFVHLVFNSVLDSSLQPSTQKEQVVFRSVLAREKIFGSVSVQLKNLF